MDGYDVLMNTIYGMAVAPGIFAYGANKFMQGSNYLIPSATGCILAIAGAYIVSPISRIIFQQQTAMLGFASVSALAGTFLMKTLIPSSNDAMLYLVGTNLGFIAGAYGTFLYQKNQRYP